MALERFALDRPMPKCWREVWDATRLVMESITASLISFGVPLAITYSLFIARIKGKILKLGFFIF